MLKIALRLASVVLATLIGAGAAAAQDQSQRAPDVVNFIIVGNIPGRAPHHDIAVGIGAYELVEKELGTRFQFISVDTGASGMAALLGGSGDFLIGSASELFKAAHKNQPVVGLMRGSQGGELILVAPKRFESRGTGLSALKNYDGATWGIIAAGGINATFTQMAVESAGLKWEDQRIVTTGSVNASASAIAADRLDITGVDAATAGALLAKDLVYVVANLSDANAIETLGDVTGISLSARKEVVEKYPGLVQAVVLAEIKGLLRTQELISSPLDAYRLYPEDYRARTNESGFVSGWNLYVETIRDMSGQLTDSTVKATSALLNRIGALPVDAKFPPYAINTNFVRESYRLLGLPVPD